MLWLKATAFDNSQRLHKRYWGYHRLLEFSVAIQRLHKKYWGYRRLLEFAVAIQRLYKRYWGYRRLLEFEVDERNSI